MRITVKLFASFREGRFQAAERDYPDGTRIADVITDLGIPPADVGMIFVAGRHAEADRLIAEGDGVSLFPLLGGG